MSDKVLPLPGEVKVQPVLTIPEAQGLAHLAAAEANRHGVENSYWVQQEDVEKAEAARERYEYWTQVSDALMFSVDAATPDEVKSRG